MSRNKLTVVETALRFGVSRQRVLVWIHEGRLGARWEYGIGGPTSGRWLISERALRPKPRRSRIAAKETAC